MAPDMVMVMGATWAWAWVPWGLRWWRRCLASPRCPCWWPFVGWHIILTWFVSKHFLLSNWDYGSICSLHNTVWKCCCLTYSDPYSVSYLFFPHSKLSVHRQGRPPEPLRDYLCLIRSVTGIFRKVHRKPIADTVTNRELRIHHHSVTHSTTVILLGYTWSSLLNQLIIPTLPSWLFKYDQYVLLFILFSSFYLPLCSLSYIPGYSTNTTLTRFYCINWE